MFQQVKDMVNHPPHYTSLPAKCECGRTIECIDVTQHMNFNLGNAVKYVWRSGDKGKLEEDINKAIWYLKQELKRITPVKANQGLGDLAALKLQQSQSQYTSEWNV